MASSSLQVYRCSKCGAQVEVVRGGGGTLVCCRQPMDLLTENSVDAAEEKHVPVVEPVDGGFKVVVGSVAHPMQEDHLIEWIELIADGKAYRQSLAAGDAPEATFAVDDPPTSVRALCNLHGLWKAQ